MTRYFLSHGHVEYSRFCISLHTFATLARETASKLTSFKAWPVYYLLGSRKVSALSQPCLQHTTHTMYAGTYYEWKIIKTGAAGGERSEPPCLYLQYNNDDDTHLFFKKKGKSCGKKSRSSQLQNHSKHCIFNFNNNNRLPDYGQTALIF